MSGSTLGWSGDSNDPVNLAVNIGKLQTFCRNLEDRIEKNENLKDESTKLRLELDELKAKTSELKARLVSVEDLIDEVESTKKILKMLNPKSLAAILAIIMGGSVGGSTLVDSMSDDTVHIEEKVENQDYKFRILMDKIKELESEDQQ